MVIFLDTYALIEVDRGNAAYKRYAIVIEIDDRIITDADKLKLVNLKKRLSFADCIGYATARKFGAKFVTGDYAFKGLENVEFVV